MNNQNNDAAISDTDLDGVAGGWSFFLVATTPAVTTSRALEKRAEDNRRSDRSDDLR
jgi:hypothetical protein